ncbi:MAG TPA: hypothetical protein VJN64_16345 [Terriglobales bacterium]|nr:hypothetical protein [Terriglobales bacterium]
MSTNDPNEDGEGEFLNVATSTGFGTTLSIYFQPSTITLPPAAAAGVVTASIVGADGDESATVTVKTAHGCSTTVPTPMPSPPGCPVQGLTPDQKRKALAIGVASAAIGAGLSTSSVTGLLCGPAAPVCVGILEGSGVLLAAGNSYYAGSKGIDPPDPNFTVIVQPQIPTLTPIVAQPGISQQMADALNALNTNNVKVIAYAQAAITSMNRTQSAADAGDGADETAQFQAEQSYSATEDTLIAAEPGLLANLQNAWIASGSGSVTVSPFDVLNSEFKVIDNGFPASVTQLLRQAGLDSSAIQMLQGAFFTLDINQASGVFPAKLTDPTLENAIQTYLATFAIPVAIDVKPGEDPPSINPGSNGKTPVAILSTSTFDAPAQVDPASLTFGRTGDEQSVAFCSGAEDVNGDGLPDLVCHFRTNLTGFQAGDTVATLQGATKSGQHLKGTDAVVIVPR